MTTLKKTKTTRFLHLVNVQIIRAANNVFLPLGLSFAGGIAGTFLFLGPGDMIVRLGLSLLGGSVAGIAAFAAQAGLYTASAYLSAQLNDKGSGLLSPLNHTAYYNHNTLKLAQRVNSEVRFISAKDMPIYKRQVWAQFIVLSKDLWNNDYHDLSRAESANRKTYDLLRENVNVNFIFNPNHFYDKLPNHETPDNLADLDKAFNQRPRFSQQLPPMSTFITEVVAQQNLTLLDLSYDLLFKEKIQKLHELPQAALTQKNSTICLLADAVLQANSCLSANETKELIEVLKQVKDTKALTQFLRVMSEKIQSPQQLDIPAVCEFVANHSELSAQATKLIFNNFNALAPDMVLSPKASIFVGATKSVGPSDVDLIKQKFENIADSDKPGFIAPQIVESLFPKEFLVSISDKELDEKFNNLGAQASEENAQNFRKNLKAIQNNLYYLEKNHTLLDPQEKIKLKVMCLKSVPALVSYIDVIGVLTPENFTKATQGLAASTHNILEQIETYKQDLGAEVLKNIQVIEKQFENKKAMTARR